MVKRYARRQAIKTILGSASALALYTLHISAFGQVTKAVNASLAVYNGADRQQRLIDGARKEGNALTIYTSAPPDDKAVFIDAFE